MQNERTHYYKQHNKRERFTLATRVKLQNAFTLSRFSYVNFVQLHYTHKSTHTDNNDAYYYIFPIKS